MSPKSKLLVNTPVILSSEDRHRMSRLYEEVRIRLEEMAMITARTLKIHAGRSAEVKFCPLPSTAELEIEAVELVRTAHTRGVYDYRQGACLEFAGVGSEALPQAEENKR